MVPDSKTFSFPRPAWVGGLLLAAGLGLGVQADAGRGIDRLFAAAIAALQPARAHAAEPGLPDYEVRIEARPVEGIARNLSGLTWDERRGHLWAVVNDPPQLVALSTEGEVLARHPLDGFTDVEGIAWLGDDRLLLVEERHQALVVVAVPATPGEPLARRGQQALTLSLGDVGNQGFEGVAYDRDGDRLFVVKEHWPRKLFEIRGLRASLDGRFGVDIIDREAWIADKFVARDFSSVEYDERTGHVILLSDASRLALEIDGAGRYVGYQALAGGFAGLRDAVPQAEGMTFDSRGNLYVVSEPNLFYAFRPQ